jgi:hypothetical protein
MTTTVQTDFKVKAERELRDMRQFCSIRGVGEEVRSIRENLALARLSPADIGTSEAELQSCFKAGNKSSAEHWLRAAKERSKTQNVSNEISHIRSRLDEAKLTLDDIGCSEEEISALLPASQKKHTKRWNPFRRHSN